MSPLRRARLLPVFLLATSLAACGGEPEADAHGNFEAIEVTVSAEATGRLLRFEPDEGARLAAGRVVGTVDTVDAALRLRELDARRAATEGRRVQAARELEAVEAELAAAREELARDRRLLADSAATARQVNLREREVRVLESRREAARAALGSAGDEVAAAEAGAARVEKQLREDARIRNPVEGRVLVAYVETGEFVSRGTPLYDVARTDTLVLHAYVTGAQLSRVRIGQEVTVRWDVGTEERASRSGTVTRVADEAEFTPTPIQTRDERVDFVYEIEVAVPNPDGDLKVGMPGEVVFPPTDAG